MRLTKRQLKRIIREEYSRLKRRGLVRESNVRSSRRRLDEMSGDHIAAYEKLQGEDRKIVDEEIQYLNQTQGLDIMDAFREAMDAWMGGQLR